MITQGCHAIWLAPKVGEKKRILRVEEADPGSGGSVGAYWSSDSKAIFLRGQSSGIDCRGTDNPEIRMIYTLLDGKLWRVK
jgi:hypothetical protein